MVENIENVTDTESENSPLVLDDDITLNDSETEEESKEEETEKDKGNDVLSSSQIRELQESLSMMKSVMSDVQSTFNTHCTLNSIKPEIYDKISTLTKEEFDNLNDVDLEKIYLEFKETEIEVKEDLTHEELKERLAAIHESAFDLKDLIKQSKELEEEVNIEIKKYTNYVLSPEYAAKQAEKISKLEQRLKETDDEKERKSIAETLNIIMSSKTLDFLFARFKKYDKKEIENIVSAFFSKDKSTYILKRYKDTAGKLNLNKDIYARFVNLEEKYLPEQYHAFNNLFVFITIRMIAYADTTSKSDVTYIGAILQQLTKLFFNKFGEEDKEKFILTVENVLNYFIDYTEKFKKDNESYKEHPYRIKMKELREKKLAEEEAAKKAEEVEMEDDVTDIIEDVETDSDAEEAVVDEDLSTESEETIETTESAETEGTTDSEEEYVDSITIGGRKIILQ